MNGFGQYLAKLNAKHQLLDAAAEWTIADEKAVEMLGTDAFKNFFDTFAKFSEILFISKKLYKNFFII